MKNNKYPGYDMMRGVRLELFNDDGIRMIDHATMDVLENYGVKITDPEARDIYRNAGCFVDDKECMVKIPERVVRQALESAPSKFYIYGRDEKNTVVQEHKGKVCYTCFGTGIQMCRYLGNNKFETVDSTSKDVEDCGKIVDWAENIDYFSLPVSARDWAGKGLEDVHEALISLKSTTKHFHHIDPVGTNVEYYRDLVVAYYGGDEQLARDKPILSMTIAPTSPLELCDNATQVIIKGARYGIPVDVISMAMCGGTSPVHLAGTLVTHNAEVLSGITLSQLTCPGARVWYGSSTTSFDLLHGTAPVGAPELALISASVVKLGQYYGLPTFVAGVQTDAKVPDAQASHEKTLTGLLPSMSGANTVYGSGMLELGMTFCMEQLVIDNEIIRMIKKTMEGVSIDESTILESAIKEVGAGNDFIGHMSTIENMGVQSVPTIFDRNMLGDWKAAGSKDIVDVAHEVVLDVMSNHVVTPIPEDKLKVMDAIVKKADEAYFAKMNKGE